MLVCQCANYKDDLKAASNKSSFVVGTEKFDPEEESIVLETIDFSQEFLDNLFSTDEPIEQLLPHIRFLVFINDLSLSEQIQKDIFLKYFTLLNPELLDDINDDICNLCLDLLENTPSLLMDDNISDIICNLIASCVAFSPRIQILLIQILLFVLYSIDIQCRDRYNDALFNAIPSFIEAFDTFADFIENGFIDSEEQDENFANIANQDSTLYGPFIEDVCIKYYQVLVSLATSNQDFDLISHIVLKISCNYRDLSNENKTAVLQITTDLLETGHDLSQVTDSLIEIVDQSFSIESDDNFKVSLMEYLIAMWPMVSEVNLDQFEVQLFLEIYIKYIRSPCDELRQATLCFIELLMDAKEVMNKIFTDEFWEIVMILIEIGDIKTKKAAVLVVLKYLAHEPKQVVEDLVEKKHIEIKELERISKLGE